MYAFIYINEFISSEHNPTYILHFYHCFSSPKTKHFILRIFANIDRKVHCVREGEKEKAKSELSSIKIFNPFHCQNGIWLLAVFM